MERQKIVRIGRLPISIEVSKLQNGVTVATARNRSANGVAIGIGSRSFHETRKLHGARHFVEHLILKGSKECDSRTLAETLEYAGADFNAFTRQESIVFTYEIDSWHEAKNLFPVFAEPIAHPAFTQRDVERERGAVLTEIGNIHDDTLAYAQELADQALFRMRPVVLPVLGTAQKVGRYTSAFLHEVHKKNFTADRLIVVGAGKVNHEELVRLSKQLFGSLPEWRSGYRYAPEETHPIGRVEKRLARESNKSSVLVMAFNISPILQYKADLPAFKLMLSILGKGSTSRLNQELREKRGLCYATHTSLDLSRSYAVAYFEADCCRPTRLPDIERLMLVEIDRLRCELVPQREFRGNIKQMRSGIRKSVDQPGELCEEIFLRMIDEEPEELHEAYRSLAKVKPSDVRRVARYYLNPQDYAVAVIEGKKHVAA